MATRRYFISTLTFLLLLLPVTAHSHLMFFEGEVFRRYAGPTVVMSVGDFKEIGFVNNPTPDWGEKQKGMPEYGGMFAAPLDFGGEDWSFDYPFLIPDGEIGLARSPNGYLSKGDVDVFKYSAAEGEEFCLMFYIIVPFCAEYEGFYPVMGILGPGVQQKDTFPFDYPADCKDCGFQRTQTLRPTGAGKRPGGTFLPRTAYPYMGSWYITDWETEAISMNLKGPGSFYLVVYNPEGKPGDYSALWGWDECEDHYKPEDMYLHKWISYYADDMKWTRVICKPAEGGEIPMSAMIPDPPPCGYPSCPGD